MKFLEKMNKAFESINGALISCMFTCTSISNFMFVASLSAKDDRE